MVVWTTFMLAAPRPAQVRGLATALTVLAAAFDTKQSSLTWSGGVGGGMDSGTTRL